MRRCNKNKQAATSKKPSPRNTITAGVPDCCVQNLFNIQIVNPLILSRSAIKVDTLTKYSKHARNLLVTLVVLRPDTLSKELTYWFDQFEILIIIPVVTIMDNPDRNCRNIVSPLPQAKPISDTIANNSNHVDRNR